MAESCFNNKISYDLGIKNKLKLFVKPLTIGFPDRL